MTHLLRADGHAVHPGEILARNLTGNMGTILTHAARMDDPACASEAFHQIRSSCKKIRALTSLCGGILTPRELRGIRSSVSELKDIVAKARDRDVLILRLRELEGPGATNLPRKPRPMATSATVFPIAGELARLIRGISLKGLTPQLVQLEISKTYSRASAHAMRCQKKTTDVRLHEWRKQVKALQFQCGAFPDWKPLDVMALRASLLARLLGDHHDLAVAAQFLRRKKKKKRHLLKSLASKRAHLATEALAKGRLLFCLTPREFARGIDR